ncbi:MAG: hypothetical protein AB7U81_11930, partial [Thiohalomonadaceae bacterium]
MSLETQIAALTTAANNLTNEVSGKMESINAAVANAIAAIPNNIRNYWVDPINGNDSNDGSQAAPFMTIKRACDGVPVGGVGEIILTNQNDRYVLEHDVYLENKIITLLGADRN